MANEENTDEGTEDVELADLAGNDKPGPEAQTARQGRPPTGVDLMRARARLSPEEKIAFDAEHKAKLEARAAAEAPATPHRFAYNEVGQLKCAAHPGCVARPGR